MPVAEQIYYFTPEGAPAEALPVVFVHGAGGNQLYWPPEIRRLPGYRIFALDLPGHGKSTGQGQQSILGYTQQVVKWLEAVGLSQAVFVGHSMGSAIALSLALHFPEQVLGLGVVGGGGRLRVRPDILEDCASPTTFHKAVDSILGGAFGPEADPRLVEMAGKRMLETRQTVLYGDLMACDTFDILQQIERITQPTLVLVGSEDRMAPPRYSQYLADAIPGAVLQIIPEAGHMVQLEKPVETAAALDKFLAGIVYVTGATRASSE